MINVPINPSSRSLFVEQGVLVDYDHEILRCCCERIPFEEGNGKPENLRRAFYSLYADGFVVPAVWDGKWAYKLSEEGERLYGQLAVEVVKRRLLR